MTERTDRLRRASLSAVRCISPERAVLLTEFYREQAGRDSVTVTRAKSLYHLCQHKTVYLGDEELIVG